MEPLWIGLGHLKDSMRSLLSVGHAETCSTSTRGEIAAILKRQVRPGKAIDFGSLGSSGQQLMSNVFKNEFFTEQPDCQRSHSCGEQGTGVVCGSSSAKQSRYEPVTQLPMSRLTVEVAN